MRVHFEILYSVTKDIITVFIKAVVFNHVYLPWLIQTKEQNLFGADEEFLCWCKYGTQYNTTICSNLHGHVFEDFLNYMSRQVCTDMWS